MYIVEVQTPSGAWEQRSRFEDCYPLVDICAIGKHISQVLRRAVCVVYDSGAEQRVISQWNGAPEVEYIPRPGHYQGSEDDQS